MLFAVSVVSTTKPVQDVFTRNEWFKVCSMMGVSSISKEQNFQLCFKLTMNLTLYNLFLDFVKWDIAS